MVPVSKTGASPCSAMRPLVSDVRFELTWDYLPTDFKSVASTCSANLRLGPIGLNRTTITRLSVVRTDRYTTIGNGAPGRNLHLHTIKHGFTDRWAHSCPADALCSILPLITICCFSFTFANLVNMTGGFYI